MTERKKLSDILCGTTRDELARQWQTTDAADDLAPLPTGEYVCRVLSGGLFNARSGTPGYKVTLEVTEGEYEGRRVWHDVWLTPLALPMAKRDLGKLGITDLEQLERPLPPGILVRARVSLRRSDDGAEYNRIVRFQSAGVEPGDAFEPPRDADDSAPDEGELFPFGANAPSRNGSAPGPYDRSERR